MNGAEAKVARRARLLVCGLLALAACLLAVQAVEAGALNSPGCLDGGSPAVVAGLDDGIDLRLADGRIVRLLGIDPGAGDTARDRLAQWLSGHAVRVVPFGAGPDRWGRTPALVFAEGSPGDAAVSVSEALLEAGLVRARPSGLIAPCWNTFLQIEKAARDDRRGIWAGAGRVIAATDGSSLRAHTGEFVIVEGVADSLHATFARTYLRFVGTHADPVADGTFAHGMAVSFDKRTGDRLRREGIDPAGWLHRRLRIRGFLDDRWGLQIDLSAAEQVEVVGP